MARKKQAKTASKSRRKAAQAASEQASAAESTTISTRMTAQHRELIEKAAAIANVSPAKFIRQAAVDRAVDVINADGDSVAALRRLAQVVVEQLQNPTIVENWQEGVPHPDPEVEHDEYRWQDIHGETGFSVRMTEHQIREHKGWKYVCSMPKPLSRQELEQLHMALKTAGSVVVQLILEQWRSAFDRPDDYRPTVWKDRIEGGDIDV